MEHIRYYNVESTHIPEVDTVWAGDDGQELPGQGVAGGRGARGRDDVGQNQLLQGLHALL